MGVGCSGPIEMKTEKHGWKKMTWRSNWSYYKLEEHLSDITCPSPPLPLSSPPFCFNSSQLPQLMKSALSQCFALSLCFQTLPEDSCDIYERSIILRADRLKACASLWACLQSGPAAGVCLLSFSLSGAKNGFQIKSFIIFSQRN